MLWRLGGTEILKHDIIANLVSGTFLLLLCAPGFSVCRLGTLSEYRRIIFTAVMTKWGNVLNTWWGLGSSGSSAVDRPLNFLAPWRGYILGDDITSLSGQRRGYGRTKAIKRYLDLT